MISRELSHFLKRLLLFAGFSAAVYWLCIILSGELLPQHLRQNLSYLRGAYGHTFTRMQEAKNTRNVDILFLGSSHTYRGFDPRIFAQYKLKTFNLGSSSQTPVHTKVLLKRYLDKLNPKIVICEVYPEIFSLDGVESSLDIISNDHNDRYSAGLVMNNTNVKVLNTLLFSVYRNLIRHTDHQQEQTRKGPDTYIPGGFVERDMARFRYEMAAEPVKRDLKPFQLKAFREDIELLQSRGIRVILVQAPITRAFYASFANPQAFDSLMRTCGEYHNFNETMQLDDSLHFYDAHHLNQEGVRLFNQEIVRKILK
jgi:hypothetical protein